MTFSIVSPSITATCRGRLDMAVSIPVPDPSGLLPDV
jgi:hypothetical protein